MNEVIVYRNPGEAALWQVIMSGEFFVIICGIIAFFVGLLITVGLMDKFIPMWNYKKQRTSGLDTLKSNFVTYFPFLTGGICAFFVMKYMWI